MCCVISGNGGIVVNVLLLDELLNGVVCSEETVWVFVDDDPLDNIVNGDDGFGVRNSGEFNMFSFDVLLDVWFGGAEEQILLIVIDDANSGSWRSVRGEFDIKLADVWFGRTEFDGIIESDVTASSFIFWLSIVLVEKRY